MTRFAAQHRVYFIEEAVWDQGPNRIEMRTDPSGVKVVVPHLDQRIRDDASRAKEVQRTLITGLLQNESVLDRDYVLWFYTPMALRYTGHLRPAAIVYDCMDELSGFVGAPVDMRPLEAALLGAADLVTTGGQSLFEAKRQLHSNIHVFPSSIDALHFGRARQQVRHPPTDQTGLAHPRIGFAGVIDERMDLEIIRGVAEARTQWQLILLGPVVKIDPKTIPNLPNVHLLGMKPYEILPDYMAGWDVAMLPFAHNAATRFISPTKTPEYLAAGLPVVSTSIRDVVRPYGQRGLVRIADGADEFVLAIEDLLRRDGHAQRAAADEFIRHMSWDSTAEQMRKLMMAAVAPKPREVAQPQPTLSAPPGVSAEGLS